MLNIKEGLTNMSRSAIKHGSFLKLLDKQTGTDLSFNYLSKDSIDLLEKLL
jgi:hypothetical protein